MTIVLIKPMQLPLYPFRIFNVLGREVTIFSLAKGVVWDHDHHWNVKVPWSQKNAVLGKRENAFWNERSRHDLHKTEFLTRAGMFTEWYHKWCDREEKEAVGVVCSITFQIQALSLNRPEQIGCKIMQRASLWVKRLPQTTRCLDQCLMLFAFCFF